MVEAMEDNALGVRRCFVALSVELGPELGCDCATALELVRAGIFGVSYCAAGGIMGGGRPNAEDASERLLHDPGTRMEGASVRLCGELVGTWMGAAEPGGLDIASAVWNDGRDDDGHDDNVGRA